MPDYLSLPGTSVGDELRRIIEGRRRHARRLRLSALIACAAVPVAATIFWKPPVLLVWNASASAPIGLYLVRPGASFRRGGMVVAWIPAAARTLASQRRYLPLASWQSGAPCGFRGNGCKPLMELTVDIAFAGRLDGIERRLALLAAHFGELLDGISLAEVVAKDGDVHVLGEALDEPESFRKGRSAFEQETRTAITAVEQRVERPADPEVLFGILGGGAEPLRGCRKEAGARVRIRSQDLVEGQIHHACASELTIGLRRSCIQAGRVGMPSARSARI